LSVGGVMTKCELCGEEIEEESENENRCLDCYEEWGDNWPDRV